MTCLLNLVMGTVALNLQPPSMPLGITGLTRAECASKCYWDQNCSSIFFSELGMCYMSDEMFEPSELTEPAIGIQYIAWKRDDCGGDYTWHRRSNQCYKLVKSLSKWSEAAAACVQDGAALSKVDTDLKRSILARVCMNSGFTCYIGGNDLAVEGSWLWADNSAISNTFWDSDEPDVGINEHCMALDKNTGYWHNVSCNRNEWYICEIILP